MQQDKMVDTSKPEDVVEEVEKAPSEIEADAHAAADIAALDAATEDKKVEEAYTPNLKFKVLDQEKEFDEWIRPAVNKENEAKIRELYEKAHGLDHVKTQRDSERTAKAQYEGQLNELMTEIQELGEIKSKDLGMFFAKLGIPKQDVAKWVLSQAEAMEAVEKLPENMKGIYNQVEEIRNQNFELQKQLQLRDSGRQAEVLQAKRAELASTLSSPDIKPLVEEYDTRLGKPGQFQQLVIRHGAAEYEASGGKRMLSAEEAAKEVIQILGLKPATPSKADGGSTQTQKVVTAAKPAVLPNVGSGSASPTAKAPVSSIADLRKIAKEFRSGG